jgi:hypothetical protein
MSIVETPISITPLIISNDKNKSILKKEMTNWKILNDKRLDEEDEEDEKLFQIMAKNLKIETFNHYTTSYGYDGSISDLYESVKTLTERLEEAIQDDD